MAIAAVLNKITALNTVTAVTSTPATSSVADTAEEFTITPTVGGERLSITCSAANSHGSVSLSVAAGDFWNAPSAALTLTIPQNTTKTFTLDSSKYLQNDGTYAITATPASGKRLATDHAFQITVIENKAL